MACPDHTRKFTLQAATPRDVLSGTGKAGG
jgi:hypothetical protein